MCELVQPTHRECVGTTACAPSPQQLSYCLSYQHAPCSNSYMAAIIAAAQLEECHSIVLSTIRHNQVDD